MSANISFVAERLTVAVAPGSVDRRNNLVRNVRVTGPRSRNGRKYPGSVTAKAAALYGAPVNIGHHYDPRTMLPTEVPPDKKFGRIVRPRAHAEGINGDLSYNPKHPFAEPFLWACEHDPSQYSFSALKRVKWKPRRDADGDLVAESVIEVASVDIVTDGGCTSSVFESFKRFTKESGGMFPTDPRALAGQFESAGMVAGFLTDFLAALPFSAAEMEMVAAVFANWKPAAGSGGGNPELSAAIDAASGEPSPAAESYRRLKALIEAAPFDAPRRPPIQPASSVAELVAGWPG